ncbi:MAG: aminopeptidase P family protein [Armatimonadetes bacterium]|nr:aminopeptidase P family protein [Armatimonadota bacterium]
MMNSIPVEEFRERHELARRKVRERGLDALLVHSNEADFANVRYLSEYWPIFESAGVLVPSEGNPILLIGPESETFAQGHSVIPDIRKVLYYREAAEPDYPDVEVDTFEDIFSSIGSGGIGKLGIAGSTAMPVSVYERVQAALPNAEIVKADDIMYEMRAIKSESEIALLKEAFLVSELAVEEVLSRIEPGMTELQVVGIAQEAMYRNGAEYEAHPTYVLSGPNSSHAIGRPSHRVIRKGDLVQLSVGARVGGYSPSVGLPICIGRMDPAMRDLAEFGLEAHHKTIEWMAAGVPAAQVAVNFFDYVKKRGYGENLLYGPCHGLGMIEVERPWMETSSDYLLQENMTFQVDTFMQRPEYGMRWEIGARITRDGAEELCSGRFRKIIEIE